MNDNPTVTVTVTDPHAPLLNGDVPETVIEVTVSSPHGHPARLLNAAAVAADTGLRAVSKDHPAHRVAQCGRTRVHASHETTEGRCPGLDGSEVIEEVDYEGTIEHLRAVLSVIASRGCETDTTGCDLGYRTADAVDPEYRICAPCIARLVLDGEPLPVEDDRA